MVLLMGGINVSFPPQPSAEQAPLNVSEREPCVSTGRAERGERREMCLSLVAASPHLFFFSHLGHNVGYRLPYVYAKYGKAGRACLEMGDWQRQAK